MKIAYGSDFHLDHGKLLLQNKENADVLIIAGDLGALGHIRYEKRYVDFIYAVCDAFKHVIYVIGNHEDYGCDYGNAVDFFSTAAFPDNFHFLENSSVILDGIKFAGACLWTDQFKGAKASLARAQGWSDFLAIRGLTPQITMAMHKASRNYLFGTGADVIVTHFAPSGGSVHPKWAGSPDNGQFYSSLDGLIVEKGPKFWVHGHMHDGVDYKIGGTRIMCNPRGYPSEYNPRYQYKLKHFEV